MGLKYNALDSQLFVDAIKSNAQQGLEIISQVDNGNQHLVNSLGNGTGLSGAAYTAGEGLIREVVMPATSKFRSAIEDVLSDVSAYQSAENAVYQYGDLDEDDLTEQIHNKQAQKSSLENQIEYYTEMAYSNPALYDSMMSAARSTQQLLDETERQLNNLQKQLTALQEFEYQTAPLFKDSLSAFSDVVKGISALKGITVDASGHYYTNGADMSWLTKLENQGFDSEDGEDKALENAVSNLGLDDDALAYWKKEMKSELKNIPEDQWNAKIKEAAANLQFDDDGNILQISSFMQGVIVLRNGVYDTGLTEQANKEIDSENWEAVKDNFAQFLVGGLSMIGGGLLDLAGAAVITGGSGFTLTGVGAAVGVPAVALGGTMEVTGTSAVVLGGAAASNALSKMNVPVGSINYSFTTSAEDRAQEVSEKATYSPHDKHVGVKSYGSKMDLSDEEAQKVLDDAIQSGNQKYGIKDGNFYAFQCDNAGNSPTWHGYGVSGNEMRKKGALNVLKQWRDEGKISEAYYNKVIKGKEK